MEANFQRAFSQAASYHATLAWRVGTPKNLHAALEKAKAENEGHCRYDRNQFPSKLREHQASLCTSGLTIETLPVRQALPLCCHRVDSSHCVYLEVRHRERRASCTP